jgi:hypothetical protein
MYLKMAPSGPKHVVKENVWYICATNCVDGKKNKTYKTALQLFYECETWSCTLGEKHRLGVLENGVFKRTFTPK